MAFQQKNMGVMGYVAGWTCWVYRNTADTIADLEQENYFQSMADLMRTGDVIYLIAKDTVKQEYIILENGNVKTADLGWNQGINK